jgi:hypothetical protein
VQASKEPDLCVAIRGLRKGVLRRDQTEESSCSVRSVAYVGYRLKKGARARFYEVG